MRQCTDYIFLRINSEHVKSITMNQPRALVRIIIMIFMIIIIRIRTRIRTRIRIRKEKIIRIRIRIKRKRKRKRKLRHVDRKYEQAIIDFTREVVGVLIEIWIWI
jgi:hypothetical protein